VQALADPSRWRMVEALGPDERTVGDLAQALGLSSPCASHHISILKEVGVLTVRRDGKSVLCRLAERGTAVGDLVRSIRSISMEVRYVSKPTEDVHRSISAAYVSGSGAVPEFEPSRR
jgi:DNA-binding transcriptional ArsR family regulator